MLSRVCTFCAVCALLAGCANEATTSLSMMPASATAFSASADLPAPGQMPKKTMSDKVLAAMALERVTGRKPDPASFAP